MPEFICEECGRREFHENEDTLKMMVNIHEKGKGTAGVFFYEIAEQKALETTHLARSKGHPLNVEIEES